MEGEIEIRELEDVADYLPLLSRAYPNRDFDPKKLQLALDQTTNLAALVGGEVVGVVRLLTDGYLFSTIPEIVVDPGCRRRGIGLRLMSEVRNLAPTPLFFGAKKGNESFFEAAGFSRGVQSFYG